jgi:cardiolipin synthase (CMP-forming)
LKDVLTVANLLTIFRILLIAPFLYSIHRGKFTQALVIFFLASLTDFFDGYVARKFHQESKLGQVLDPAADKILTTASFIVMALPHPNFPSLPLWLAVVVVGRDLVILIGSWVVYARTRFKDFKPSTSGKVNTFLELGLVVWFLWFHVMDRFTILLPFCYLIVLGSVLVSGGSYLLQGRRIIRDYRRTNLSA